MVKKYFFRFGLLLTLGITTLTFTFCSKEDETPLGEISNEESGVVINGVHWATRNVNGDGSFVDSAEKPGLLFKRDKVNIPDGWRLPDTLEIQKLLDTEKVTNEWTSVKGVSGRKFIDKATGNTIFLPAAGYKGTKGSLYGAGKFGHYWIGVAGSDENNTFYFDEAKTRFAHFEYRDIENKDANGNVTSKTLGLCHSVRCVAK